ncbi:PAS domain S-box protein [Haloferax mediterranei ATCC 33500]|uniref:Bacterio-opsin activator-like protein n=1 Tax=Haloferax mediterranei (strain ATCC 33500 / DSM 1411 / JCM 8866 / NBRC 14739 / NCIMB 2177 / R-4) TaxID=523841 RepID=I3R6K5_HALMT|nr:bacterio-opsin activator domain-containing protein [Haloferax mediterranei]AFK19865.1 bacterio-opsin activator-like protein [Haloferax mediterranei ATCC 33500]ELZ99832.1 bacterio-opsin activator-like protein [Haloferax mediterranei ATCC 33500]MDX5987386.1 bacterio-opsin activator domain-containing protein [Haloferax mediterranei ATCC 33500]QCQ73893.1 PAS domain S-box protein [Haloferax mediterranei ATCC 33500]
MDASAGTLNTASVVLVGKTSWVAPVAVALQTSTEATVRMEPTAEDALEAVRSQAIDCVITEYELDESTGLELLARVREYAPTLPVVLCTAGGSESLASDAIAAGVDDYIALSSSDTVDPEHVLSRAERCLRDTRRTGTRRERARQFDAIFHDSRTATWVLDADGNLARVNRTAQEMVDRGVEEVVGRPFWELPWWTDSAGTREDVKQIIDPALNGTFGNAVVTRPDADSVQVIELSARPVHSERGELVSVVVEGVDITDRVDLERDLRQSEELHRVTLNNMTDTVLMTDEAGEYTYVCPNVHFIFGYSADEIRELGGIDELLGEDLFDRDELASEGVLKNIECTATDKLGREHTLLVNVREVSIQDGTLLYSCRDITKRKQREEALATLQETARDFLYAETKHEIAQHVVDDTAGVLDVDASAVYLFDAKANDLRPVASSPEIERVNGPLSVVHADTETLPSHSFVEDEALFFDDVHDAQKLENRATDLRSAAYVPLGEHGVFVVGSPDVAVFDDVARELVDLLAATAEAALDRVARESTLREQDRELQRRNDQLTALNRINETIREIDQALVQAETREEIEHTVCELLTADDRFDFAWIGTADSATGTLEPRAWSGAEQGYLDSVMIQQAQSGSEPSVRTAATQQMVMVTNVASKLRQEEWRKHALSRDFLSVLSIPLVYNEFSYGVLTVYADSQHAFDETAQAVLGELGETIASATSALERKNALLTTSLTRLEFGIDDSTFVLSRLAAQADCSVSYQGGVQQTADGTFVFVTVDGTSVKAVERAAADILAVDDVQRISADGTGGVLRLRLSQPFLALELADHGAVLRSATADTTRTTVVIDVPESVDLHHVTDLVKRAFAVAELRSKRTFDQSKAQTAGPKFFERLTERQLEVLQTAYYSGFFESPRENTGEDVADMLDISPPAFYQHVRTVQRKLFSTLFEDASIPASTDSL